MEAGEFTTIQELADAVGLAERHVSRQRRLAYMAPEVLKRLTCGREGSTVSLYDLCLLAGEAWGEQLERAVGQWSANRLDQPIADIDLMTVRAFGWSRASTTRLIQ